MTKIGKSDSVIRVEEFLRKEVASCEVKELQKTARTAKDAANSLNVCLGAIVKTLVFYCDHKATGICVAAWNTLPQRATMTHKFQ